MLPPESEVKSIMGVDYTLIRTDDGSEVYLTSFGLPFRKHLVPENWYEPDWFNTKRERLVGTSVIYKVPTKPVRNLTLHLVARFSRVGEEIPLDPRTLNENPQAEFNSPFEEFALVMALRARRSRNVHPYVWTKKPLAIYVPARKFQDWELGRSESKLESKRLRQPEVPVDTSRQYILLYRWIKGLNAVQVTQALGMNPSSAEQFRTETTARAVRDLKEHGFRMIDIKPEHVILRLRGDGSLLKWPDGNLVYALVDYELLEPIGDPNRK